MAQWHMKSATKVSGGVRTTLRASDKRLAWKGGEATLTTIAPSEEAIDRITARGMGNTEKVKLRKGRFVVATSPDSKKAAKYEVLSVVENHADTQFARRNIITKGAVVKASAGSGADVYVKVTSRPGQHGTVSGVVLKSYTPPSEEKALRRKESKKAKTGPKAPKSGEKAEIGGK